MGMHGHSHFGVYPSNYRLQAQLLSYVGNGALRTISTNFIVETGIVSNVGAGWFNSRLLLSDGRAIYLGSTAANIAFEAAANGWTPSTTSTGFTLPAASNMNVNTQKYRAIVMRRNP